MKTISPIMVCFTLICCGCSTFLNTMEIPAPFFTGIEHHSIPQTDKECDVPRYDETRGRFAGKPIVYYTWAKQREEQLGLISPEASEFNQLLRVWGTFSYHPRRQRGFLAEFVHDGAGWRGRFYDYHIRYNEWGSSEVVQDAQSFPLGPTNGWSRFDDVLRETGLIDLPTDEMVSGLKEWVRQNRVDTAETYSVEYSTPTLYRFFIFQNPHRTQEHFMEPAKFMEFHDYMFDIVHNSEPIRVQRRERLGIQNQSEDEKPE